MSASQRNECLWIVLVVEDAVSQEVYHIQEGGALGWIKVQTLAQNIFHKRGQVLPQNMLVLTYLVAAFQRDLHPRLVTGEGTGAQVREEDAETYHIREWILLKDKPIHNHSKVEDVPREGVFSLMSF